MPISLPDCIDTAPQRSNPSVRGPKHEPHLHKAQGLILDRELELRKIVLAQNERVIAAFEGLIPRLGQKSPVLVQCAEQIREIARELDRMKEQERNASVHPELPRPTGDDREIVLENARRASANQAYFNLLSIFQTLITSINGLFLNLLRIDPSLAATIRPTREILDASWKKIAPFAASLLTRPVTLSSSKATPEDVRQAGVIWQELLRRDPANVYLHSLKPHGGTPGPVRILYFTVGGLGDALLQTPCIAELKRRFSPCEILVVHSRSLVHALFSRNRTVDGTLYVGDDLLCKVPAVAKVLGIFDLVVESRFIVWAELCDDSRIAADTDLKWVTNTHRAVTAFAPYIERFPHYNNLFARIVRPQMLLDLHGASAGLPLTVDSPLVLCPDGADADHAARLGLVANRYVTVHDGFDEGFARQMGINRCTKQLPVGKWRELIAGLQREGFKVVQVGVPNEPELHGVDLDLRGKTSISQLCFVLKSAAVHIDTEGGIVHVARAVHKRSIVFFGPTSVSFWGYPQNINLCSEEYADHWWISSDWMARSPVAQKRSAMEAFDVAGVARLAVKEREAQHLRRFDLVERTGVGANEGLSCDHVRQEIRRAANREGQSESRPLRIAFVGNYSGELIAECSALSADIDVFVRTATPPSPGRAAQSRVTVHLSSFYNLPANSDRYDLVFCVLQIESVAQPAALLTEMVRLLRVGGGLTFVLMAEARGNVSADRVIEGTAVDATTAPSLLRRLEQLCGQSARTSASVEVPPQTMSVAAPVADEPIRRIRLIRTA